MQRTIVLTAILAACGAVAGAAVADDRQAPPLRIAIFRADITPPIGAPLCSGLVPPAETIVDPLSARGIVLLTDEAPIVLCALDWVGVGNAGHDAWREALAEAAGTTAERVAVHCLHQHDAPCCDFSAEELAASRGLGGKLFDVLFAREALARTADALRRSLASPQAVTHLGLGRGRVQGVASNRRILGPDGRVLHVRYSSCRDEAVRAFPEGTIDPDVRLVALFDGDRPLASLTYYATHPQSYYGQGGVSADFVGLARAAREAALPDVAHLHFNGAGGNVAAGKYNDGSPAMRPILAARLADGMRAAWDAVGRVPVDAADVAWQVAPVTLPPRDTLVEADLVRLLDDSQAGDAERLRAARDLAFLRRAQGGHQVPLACLRLGAARIVHLPGELFVEYQLAAQAMRPDGFVAMAAYGDYGAGYIGTEVSYGEGGYETSSVSRVGPSVEAVLTDALRALLD